jgi:ABC-type branched-subunit amino acid transport system substrate-binding protein
VTYLAMYGPQAGATVKAMAGTTGGAKASYGYCLVDLAAQGSTYTDAAGSASDTCLASGVPAPDQLPSATAGGYVQDYQARFHTTPGTWGPFVYDSVEIWAQAADKAKAVSGAPVRQNLLSTADYAGVTGTTTIVAPSGNRSDPPVVILDVSESGQYSVDASWAQAAGYHQS